MSRIKRFAFVLLVLAAVSITVGLTGTQKHDPESSAAATAPVNADIQHVSEAPSPDPFFGQQEFSFGTERACNVCFSIPCQVQGSPCSTPGSGCRCKFCNGQFNCFK